jgi:pimeloyl-ACP methyl ester carboxylesterase
MVATYAAAYLPNSCAGAVNLDAIWLDTDEAAAWAATMERSLLTSELFQPVSLEQLSTAVPQRMVSGNRPLPIALAAIVRAILETSDGRYVLRPDRSGVREVLAAIAAFDMPAILRDLQRRLLVYVAQHDDLPASEDQLQARTPGRRERTEAFAAMAKAQTNLVEVDTIRASHALIIDEPETVARRVREFASEVA